MKRAKLAVVLLSGGLDSATTLFLAKKKGFRCHCLIFDYGQRHRKEIEAAKRIVKIVDERLQILKIRLPWKGSALLDKSIRIPTRKNLLIGSRAFPRFLSGQVRLGYKNSTPYKNSIPSTYVPARNIIFLSFALSFAESIGAERIFIGANAVDFSGYPDCRPEFYRSYQKVIEKGTKAGAEGNTIKIEIPLLRMSKAQIIKLGKKLGVPFELTWSCYKGGRKPCGVCDSCRLRAKGFKEVDIEDPLIKK